MTSDTRHFLLAAAILLVVGAGLSLLVWGRSL
jgi:hypothetical protein